MSKEIPLFKVFMSSKAAHEASNIINSGYIGQGPVVDKFETQLTNYFNHPYIVTTNSATSAEHLALHLLKKPSKNKYVVDGVIGLDSNWPGLEPGDEVLTTALTCTATNWPILANGLNIKWVDIDPKTLNMSLEDLESKITPKTKVIIVVHWGGYPLDLDKLKQIQERAKLKIGFKPAIIEDCAHAFGSEYKGKKLGTHGNICTFSLQAIKHVTSVDGGLLFVPHKDLYERAKLLRWYGIDRESNRKDFRCEANIPEWGFKFHMNDVNASIGIENLKFADSIIQRHRENSDYYDQHLKGVKGVELLTRHNDRKSSSWIYSILVENKQDFYNYMMSCGIATSQVHERNDIHSCVSEYKSDLPNLDLTTPKLSAIPVGWWVTDSDRKYIVDCIKKGW